MGVWINASKYAEFPVSETDLQYYLHRPDALVCVTPYPETS